MLNRPTSPAQRARPRLAGAFLASAAALLLASCSDSGPAANRASLPKRAQARFHCAATHPNGLAPPGEPGGPTNFGNGRLWTLLPLGGELAIPAAVPAPPGTVFGELHRDGSLSTKFPWWGARHAGRQLLITGQRVDGRARPLRASIAPGVTHAPHFWASTITFATQGCWSVTARAGRAQLAFTVHVRRG
jgi:hypothetical protein